MGDIVECQRQTAFQLPEGDFAEQGQEKGRANGGTTLSKVGHISV